MYIEQKGWCVSRAEHPKKRLEQFLIGYVRGGDRAEDPLLPALVVLVNLGLDVLAEVLAVVAAAALGVAQYPLAALVVAVRPHRRVLPVVSASWEKYFRTSR